MRRPPPTAALKMAIFAVVTVAVTGLLGTIVANTSFQPTHRYSALFTDATSVEGGETVRLAGVPVGTVTGARIVDAGTGRLARVDFTVDESVPLYRDAQLLLRYENIVGRRYLTIVEHPGSRPVMRPGETFGVDHTVPALDLTVLFNGFQPLFRALDPGQVNQLSYEIIQTLQGESATMGRLLAHTASLTSTLADSDAVIGRVVDNLTTVLATVDQRDTELTRLIERFRDLMRGLADDRSTIDDGIPAFAGLLGSADDLLSRARSPLRADVGGLGSLAGQLADTREVLDDRLNRLPTKLATASRLSSYGGWINFALCGVDARVSLLHDSIDLSSPANVSANERDTVCGAGRPQ
ncbi:MCE family protein [Pseudonocardia spinosispora]|uniref:MCE family protein n=1 Tax=Pseudonocardia spinosispora TaxID=103441 RepID=UPI00042A612A|nr:MCE family protein [Pseudonocardia spinosispora]